MFAVLNSQLAAEVSVVRDCLDTHTLLRNLVAGHRAGGIDGSDEVPQDVLRIVDIAPPSLEWRIFDHSAAFTRLYAAYERFVFDLIAQWLESLPKLYSQYADLPEAVRTNHRIGVAEILNKLGGDRYKHLSEKDVLKGIANGHWGEPFTLLTDAFKTDDRNLRKENVQGMFKKCGIDNIWRWVDRHADVRRFLAEVRGDSSTAESELRDFVFARNEAAHGVVDSVVSIDELNKMSEFIKILCNVMAEAVHRQFILRKLELGQARRLGTIIHNYSDQIIGVQMASGTIEIGDKFVVLQEDACFNTEIESIEIKHRPYRVVSIWGDTEVGLRVTKPGRAKGQVIRLTSP